MTEKRYNQKRACALAGIDPRVYRRVSKRPADIELRDRLKDLSSERRRFGYRRLHIRLKREDWHVNHCPTGYCAAMSREGEEAVPDLPRRRVNRSQTGRSQAGIGHQDAHGDPARAEPAVVAGLCV